MTLLGGSLDECENCGGGVWMNFVFLGGRHLITACGLGGGQYIFSKDPKSYCKKCIFMLIPKMLIKVGV